MAEIRRITDLERLKEMEAMAVNAAGKIMAGADELAIAVHEIFSQELYKAELDERGLPLYNNQKEYEPTLLQMLGVSRATLYNHYTPIKIACGPTFRMTYEDFIRSGGKRLWYAIADSVSYDSTTGEVTGIRKQLPDGVKPGEYIIEQIKDLAPSGVTELDLTPGELQKEVRNRLNDTDPQISFSIRANTVTWWSETEREIAQGTIGRLDNDVPDMVLAKFKKLLHIT